MNIHWNQPSTLRGTAMFCASIVATILQLKGYGDQTAIVNDATEAVLTAGMALSGLMGILMDDQPK